MGCSPFQLERGFHRGLQIAETLISMSIYQEAYSAAAAAQPFAARASVGKFFTQAADAKPQPTPAAPTRGRPCEEM
jgi:hypothetical protein